LILKAKREKHKSKSMSKKTSRGVTSGTPTSAKSVVTHTLENHQKFSHSISRKRTVVQPDTGKEPQNSTPRYYFNTEIPERYNETYITAIPKDPNWLYVYWEFSDETVHLMDSNLEQSGSKLVLRLKETDVAETFEEIMPFQVEVNDISTGQYVPVPENSGEFQVECGYFSDDEGFIPVIQSEPVTIPQSVAGGQIFDIFASEEEKKSTHFDTVNDFQVESSGSKQTEFFNSQTSSSYSKPLPGSAGSIF
jgi:hypothetical protein